MGMQENSRVAAQWDRCRPCQHMVSWQVRVTRVLHIHVPGAVGKAHYGKPLSCCGCAGFKAAPGWQAHGSVLASSGTRQDPVL
jgi:hypothetical protein